MSEYSIDGLRRVPQKNPFKERTGRAGNVIICGDALEKLRELPDECVNTCITSPPYW